MAVTEDLGIAYAYKIFAQMGYFFRELTKHDFGIDAHVETSNGQGLGSSRIIAIQSKSGDSYIKPDKNGNLVHYTDEQHIKYWAEHALPVILIMYSPERDMAWWCDVKAYISRHPSILSKSPYKIEFSPESILKVECKSKFAELASASTARLSLDENYHDLMTVDDVSHLGTKRYTADILVGNANNDSIRLAIYQATEHLKTVVEHSTSIREFHWGNQAPHVVWIFVYRSPQDKVHNNWTARALWRDLSNEGAKPIKLDRVNDHVENIEIDFADSERYRVWHDHLSKQTSTKTQFIRSVDLWTSKIDAIVRRAAELIEGIDKRQIDEANFTRQMGDLERVYSEIEHQINDSAIAPTECHDADVRFASMVANGGNIFIAFSPRGLETWPETNKRMYFVRNYLKRYMNEREMLGFEMRKLKKH